MKVNNILFEIEGKSSFYIKHINIVEAINTCPVLHIIATFKEDLTLSLKDFIAKKFKLCISTLNNKRNFSGTIASINLNIKNEINFHLKSNLHLLSMDFDDALFIDKNIQEICTDILSKVYKNPQNIHFEDLNFLNNFPVVFKYKENSLSFFQRLLSNFKLNYYISYDDNGEEHIHIFKNLNLKEKIFLLNKYETQYSNINSKDYIFNVQKERLKKNHAVQYIQAQSFCLSPALPFQLKINSNEILNDDYAPSFFVSQLNYEIDILGISSESDIFLVKTTFQALSDLKFLETNKIDLQQIVRPLILKGFIDAEQEDLPDLNVQGQYKVWLPESKKSFGSVYSSFRASLLQSYLNTNSGLYGSLLKNTQVLVQWRYLNFEAPVIIGVLSTKVTDNLVTALNPQSLCLKHPSGSQAVFTENSCELNSQSKLNANSSSLALNQGSFFMTGKTHQESSLVKNENHKHLNECYGNWYHNAGLCIDSNLGLCITAINARYLGNGIIDPKAWAKDIDFHHNDFDAVSGLLGGSTEWIVGMSHSLLILTQLRIYTCNTVTKKIESENFKENFQFINNNRKMVDTMRTIAGAMSICGLVGSSYEAIRGSFFNRDLRLKHNNNQTIYDKFQAAKHEINLTYQINFM